VARGAAGGGGPAPARPAPAAGRRSPQARSLVWDTWPVPRHPAVRAVAAALGFEIVWLPTDAPWTHPIETLWC